MNAGANGDPTRRIVACVTDALRLGVDTQQLVGAAALYGLSDALVESSVESQRSTAERQGAEPEGPDRASLGAWYTPSALARGLVSLALEVSDREPNRVLDPTCGAGAFLVEAASALARSGLSAEDSVNRLEGFDIDPVALFVCHVNVANWCLRNGGPWLAPSLEQLDVVHGDFSVARVGEVDLVVGNPPFLSQLRKRTARSAKQRADVGPLGYADSSSIVLQRSVELLACEGVAALVMPRSFLSARDSAAIRSRIEASASLVAAWFDPAPMFEAAVRVFAPVLKKSDHGSGTVLLAGGDEVEVGDEVDFAGWSELSADAAGVPRLASRRTNGGVLGDLADVRADFRDWFYELAEAVVEAESDRLGDDEIGVLTSGAIDPNRCSWGERPIRLGGRRFERPVVQRKWLAQRRDAELRLQPKIVVANQTRVIEAFVDRDGRWVGNTPTIQVSPFDRSRIWSIAAVLGSPHASVQLMRRSSGNALSPKAMRLTARSVADLCLPADAGAWHEAAAMLEDGSDLFEVAGVMNAAYGLDPDDAIYRWWWSSARSRGFN